MLFIYLRFILGILFGPLWRLGGWGTGHPYPNPIPWTGWRDTVIPILTGLYWGLYFKSWWLGLLMAITSLIIRIGYGPNSNFQKYLHLSDAHARAAAGLSYVIIGYLPIAIFTHQWLTFLVFAVISTLVNYLVVRYDPGDILTELICGWCFAVGLFLFK